MNLIKYLIIFLLICTNVFANVSYIYSANDKIKISRGQIARIEDYLSKNFYSYSLKRDVFNKAPMYFLLSKNGTSSSLLSCDNDNRYLCEDTVEVSQMKMRLEKNDNPAYVIFIENRFVAKNKNIKISDKNDWARIKINYFEIIDSNKNLYLDSILDIANRLLD